MERSIKILKQVWRNWKITAMFWGPLAWGACLIVNPPVTILVSYAAMYVLIFAMAIYGMVEAVREN